MTKLYLQNNYELQVAVDQDEYTIIASLYDAALDITTVLGRWESGKWVGSTPVNLSKLFSIAKKHKRVKHIIHNAMNELRNRPNDLSSIKSNWSMFRRLTALQYHKTIKSVIY